MAQGLSKRQEMHFFLYTTAQAVHFSDKAGQGELRRRQAGIIIHWSTDFVAMMSW